MNLGAAPGEVRDKSLAAFREEMERCARLGIDKIVMHPGSHLGDGKSGGLPVSLRPSTSSLRLRRTTGGRSCWRRRRARGPTWDTPSSSCGRSSTASAFPGRFAVCFDTCHTFAAGYDITTEDGYRAVFAEFDRIIGLDRLHCFHFNDSKKGLGCRVDRHEHIGQGSMGLSGFRYLMNDSRFTAIPKILETPKGDNDEMDAVNLGRLRDLVER